MRDYTGQLQFKATEENNKKTSGVLGPDQGLLVQRRDGTTWKKKEKGHEDA